MNKSHCFWCALHYIQTLSQLLSHVAAMNSYHSHSSISLWWHHHTITHCQMIMMMMMMMMIWPPGLYCPHPPCSRLYTAAGNLATGHCRQCLTQESDTGPRPLMQFSWSESGPEDCRIGSHNNLLEHLIKYTFLLKNLAIWVFDWILFWFSAVTF